MARRKRSGSDIDGAVALVLILLGISYKAIASFYQFLSSGFRNIVSWVAEKVGSIGLIGQCVWIAVMTVTAICIMLIVNRYKREKKQEKQAELAMKRRREELESKRENDVRIHSTKLKQYADIFSELKPKVHFINEVYYAKINAKNLQQYRQIVAEGNGVIRRAYSTQDISRLREIVKNAEENRMIIQVARSKCLRVAETDEKTAQATGIPLQMFRLIEDRIIAREYTIKAVENVNWIIKIEYISPAGRTFEKSTITVDLKMMSDFLRSEAAKNYKVDEKRAERSKMNSSLRYDVLRRDGFKCQLCGRSAGDGIQLEVDHIKPISKGGKTERSNLRTLCRDCNRGKSDKLE